MSSKNPSNKPNSQPEQNQEVSDDRRNFLKLVTGQGSNDADEKPISRETQPPRVNPVMGRRAMITRVAAMLAVLGLPIDASAQLDISSLRRKDKEKTLFTEDDIERFSTTMEMMKPAEVERMQISQEAMFRGYLSPGNMLYLRGNAAEERTFREAMLAAIRHAHEMQYKAVRNGAIEITKRMNSSLSSRDLPGGDGFKIVVDNGYVTRVNGIKIPYSAQEDYDELYLKLDYPRWMKSFTDAVIILGKRPFPKDATPEKRKELVLKRFEEALQAPQRKLKILYEINNILLPQRLVELVEARNNTAPLSAEVDGYDGDTESIPENRHPNYKTFLKAFGQNPNSYDEMAANFPKGFQTIRTSIHQDYSKTGRSGRYPGVYMIYSKFTDEEGNSTSNPPIAISREGYFLNYEAKSYEVEKNEGGRTVKVRKTIYIPNPEKPEAYRDCIKNRYYNEVPEAEDLTD